MESQLQPLVEIQYRHHYFNNGLCSCLSLRPTAASHRTMVDHGLFLRTRPAGFSLWYDTRHAGNTRTRADILADYLPLRFLLFVEEAAFFTYTTPLPADIHTEVFYFYNRPGSAALHCSLLNIRKIDLRKLTGGTFEKPFAIIGLRLRPDTEPKSHIEFQSRSTRWNYILVGQHLTALNQPAIINTDTKDIFTGPVAIPLTDGRTGLSFVSTEPIDLCERPTTCMLVENFDPATGKHKIVMPVLPVPDPNILSSANSRDPNTKNDCSEILLY